MAKNSRPQKRIESPCPVGLAHGNAWKLMEWYVPFVNGNAIIYHGHESGDDHGMCGPEIFCCPKAAYIFLQQFPQPAPSNTHWDFTDGKFLTSWLDDSGPKLYYFFLCDPDDSTIVRFTSVSVPELRDVLLKRQSLASYIHNAPVIRVGDYYAE